VSGKDKHQTEPLARIAIEIYASTKIASKLWIWGAAIAVLSLVVSALGTLVLLISRPALSEINSHILTGIPVVSLAGAAICGLAFARGRLVPESDIYHNDFHQLFEMVDLAGFMVRDFGGTIRFWSNGCQDMYGWTAAEAVGRASYDLLQPVFPEPLADIEATLLRDGEWCGEVQHCRKDGKKVVVAARKILRHDESGRPQIMENITDITELHQIRRALALATLNQELAEAAAEHTAQLGKAETRFRGIFDSQLQFIGLLAPDGTILEVNRTALEVGGVERAAVVGRRLGEAAWWPQSERKRLREEVIQAGQGNLIRRDAEIVGPEGRVIWVDFSLRPVHEAGTDNVMWLIAEGHDITKQHELVEKLAQTQKMHALGQLASGIAHDFNNILQTISGAATLIERRTDEERVRRLARLALDAATRGASITERLLSFSRQTEPKREPVVVAALLNSVREVLAHAVSIGIKIRTEIPNEFPPVLVDRSQLEMALINLGMNARDAMPDGGIMTLSADVTKVGRNGDAIADLEPGPYVRIKVTDTGTGMDAATLAHATEPFFTTKPLGKGIGLGLPMAKAFAELSGGALTIETVAGTGTTIAIWVPPIVNDIAVAPTQETTELPKPAVSRDARVLLVDDDLIVRETIAAQLEDMGYRPLLASGGSEALELIKAGERLDVLVCDLSMPDMDGVEVIAHARELLPGLPSLLLTGYMGERAALSGEGSFTLVRKPVKIQVLAAHIEASLKAVSLKLS
jgi:PAS domain S-box-containing protein